MTPQEEGKEAAKKYKRYDANPYGENDKWFWQWLAGWAGQMESQLVSSR